MAGRWLCEVALGGFLSLCHTRSRLEAASEKQHFSQAPPASYSLPFSSHRPQETTLSQTLHICTLARDVQNKYKDGFS